MALLAGRGEKLTTENTAKAAHHILITFEDDHGVSGAKFDIDGVTPEQIAVAIYHLTRSANQLSDAVLLAQMQDQRQVQAVRAALEGRH